MASLDTLANATIEPTKNIMSLASRVLPLMTAIAIAIPAAHAQTLAGAAAQKSPQADALLAYEGALIAGGLDAARPHMTPEKVKDLESMVKALGEDGFRRFLDRMRSGAQGEARRKQIFKVDVKGDYAVLEARDNPNAVTVQHLAKTGNGWKVSVKR